jgi:hypothetical protein
MKVNVLLVAGNLQFLAGTWGISPQESLNILKVGTIWKINSHNFSNDG